MVPAAGIARISLSGTALALKQNGNTNVLKLYKANITSYRISKSK